MKNTMTSNMVSNTTSNQASEKRLISSKEMPCHELTSTSESKALTDDIKVSPETNSIECENCTCCPVLSSGSLIFSYGLIDTLITPKTNTHITTSPLSAISVSLYRPPIT